MLGLNIQNQGNHQQTMGREYKFLGEWPVFKIDNGGQK